MGKNNIKITGIIHFILNLMSLGLLGAIFVGILYLLQKDQMSGEEKSTYFNMINFNLSYYIYFSITYILMYVIIGFFLLPFVGIIWLFLLVIGFKKHLDGKNYKYPTSVQFLK